MSETGREASPERDALRHGQGGERRELGLCWGWREPILVSPLPPPSSPQRRISTLRPNFFLKSDHAHTLLPTKGCKII